MTSFTPINLNLYVAAYSGAVAGMATGGWITDGNPSDYALVTSIAGAYAQEFDRVWDNPTLLNSLEQACITSIISDNFEGRAPGPLNNPKFLMGSNWTISVSACIALVLESDTFFADQGITPPSPQLLPAPGPLGNLLTSDGTEWVSEPSVPVTDVTAQSVYAYTEKEGLAVFRSIPPGGVVVQFPEIAYNGVRYEGADGDGSCTGGTPIILTAAAGQTIQGHASLTFTATYSWYSATFSDGVWLIQSGVAFNPNLLQSAWW